MPKHLSRWVTVLLAVAVLFIACRDRVDNGGTGRLLILYAFSAEGELLAAEMMVDTVETHLGREVLVGELAGHEIVLAASGVGMTNAAMTAQKMIDVYDPHTVLFTGIAGAIDSSVHIGDIVVADRWRQHDYGYIGASGFEHGPVGIYVPPKDSIQRVSDFEVASRLIAVAEEIVETEPTLSLIGERKPQLKIGGVGVSGNTFIDSRETRVDLATSHQALIVDMESAAVAQVCMINAKPFLAFRSASDLAGGSGSETASVEIDKFFKVAASNSTQVVLAFLEKL